jgi:hypothetical protein
VPNQNARYAAIVAFGQKAGPRLDRGECPRCGKQPGEFRDDTSEREYEISGLCQKCQDAIFAED